MFSFPPYACLQASRPKHHQIKQSCPTVDAMYNGNVGEEAGELSTQPAPLDNKHRW